jgi:anti-anti-sigma regulatory factor
MRIWKKTEDGALTIVIEGPLKDKDIEYIGRALNSNLRNDAGKYYIDLRKSPFAHGSVLQAIINVLRNHDGKEIYFKNVNMSIRNLIVKSGLEDSFNILEPGECA